MPINFFKGHPLSRLLPAKAISLAYSSVLLTSYDDYEGNPDNRNPLTYGTDEGNLDVRKTIGEWVGKYYDRRIDPDTICLTGGASYGFANILNACTHVDYTKHAFVVSPTYYLINGALLDAGFEGRILAVKETPQLEYDIDLVALEKQLIKHSLSANTGTVIEDPSRGKWKYYSFVMYMVPTFSNPGGLTYSVKTRKKLLEIARAYDMLVVCDDVYDLLDYRENREVIPKVVHLDIDSRKSENQYGNCISNNTFSKILAPGIRFGWQECPSAKLAWQVANTGANKLGGTPGQLALTVVAKLIELGEQNEIIAQFIDIYRNRVLRTKQSVKKYLPEGTKVWGGDGGYFLWVEVAEVQDHSKVVDLLEKKGVVLAAGLNFEVVGDALGWGKHYVRLSVLYLEEQDIEEGIKQWGKEIEAQLQKELDEAEVGRLARLSILDSLMIVLTTEFKEKT
ncbi:PLP-dependent aminotransferase family protein [Kocuria palustris]|nr:PLP-dependent aminotransferase family protein [Kocuria palustris]